ncbi:MAG: DNA primase [Defluviitaleaceae bacterium]|nr:DNA primase [Defluviitaleaceae bacterium]
MFYPENIVEEVRNLNDIIDVISGYVRLTPKGSSHFGLCPFHNESTPSFSVSSEKQLFYCFGCGVSGNVFSFIMQKENFDFVEALKFLAGRINYTLPEGKNIENSRRISALKNEIYEIHTISARYYFEMLNADIGKEASNYLDLRGVDRNTQRKFGLGYAPDSWDMLYKHLENRGFSRESLLKSGLITQTQKGGFIDKFRNRLMFPIFDVQNRVVAFGGRIISDGEPKYLNSPETPIFEKSKQLYSLNNARKAGKKELILVEGYMDVISLFQAGVTNVVAALGTAFNKEHVNVLRKYASMVYILFDSDKAGEKATLRAIEHLYNGGLKTKVITLDEAKDPDDYIKKFGREEFEAQVRNSLSHVAYQIKMLAKGYDLKDTSQKIDFTKEVANILSKLDSQIEVDAYSDEAGAITGISTEAIRAEISKLRGENHLKDIRSKQSKFVPSNNLKEKRVVDAKKNIIYLAASNKNIAKKLAELVFPEEMDDAIFTKLLDMIYKTHDAGNNVYAAELLNYFEEPEEHRQVSEIFMTSLKQEDLKLIEMAINDQIKTVKRVFIEKEIAKTTDMQKIQELFNLRKNIEQMNITI